MADQRASRAATLLSKHGRSVAIFEREKFPRFKIGESLLPGSVCTFERMGVKEKIDKADVIVKYGGKSPPPLALAVNRFLFSEVFRCKYPTAYQVERSVFDRVLRQPERRAAEFARMNVTLAESLICI